MLIVYVAPLLKHIKKLCRLSSAVDVPSPTWDYPLRMFQRRGVCCILSFDKRTSLFVCFASGERESSFSRLNFGSCLRESNIQNPSRPCNRRTKDKNSCVGSGKDPRRPPKIVGKRNRVLLAYFPKQDRITTRHVGFIAPSPPFYCLPPPPGETVRRKSLAAQNSAENSQPIFKGSLHTYTASKLAAR